MTTMKKKAPNALKLIRRDSISSMQSDNGTISDPETPGPIMTDEDYQNSFITASDKPDLETPTSELLRKCRLRREESTLERRERLKFCFKVFDEKDLLLFKERCRMQNVKDVAYTVTRMLQKIDENFPDITQLPPSGKEELNLILAELIFIQMRYMEVQNFETIMQCYSTYIIAQTPVASKEVPFINGFNSIFELFIPYIQKEFLNGDSANKFFGGILLNKTINRETKLIIPLMGLILENNDLAAPIFVLQLLRIAVIVGCVEFIAGVFEGMRRTEPDREGYLQAIKELTGGLECPDDVEFSNVALETLIIFNMEFLHLAGRVACPISIQCLLKFGAEAKWTDCDKELAINLVGHRRPEEEFWSFRFSDDEIEQTESRAILLSATPSTTWPKLEDIAIENEDNASVLIETLLHLGVNPLEPNEQKLFPYHFAQTLRVFNSLTQPPVEPRGLILSLARSFASEDDKIQLLEILKQNELPIDIMYQDSNEFNAIGVAAERKENRFAQVCAVTLIGVERERIEQTKVRKMEHELKLQKLQNVNDKLQHREHLLKMETGLMQDLNELQSKHKKELELREKLIIESRKQNDEVQKHNDTMVSQLSGQQNMIDQVNIQSNKLELTMESMRIAREETNANVEKINKHKTEMDTMLIKHRQMEANHAKQLDTKKFLIGKLKEERKKLQDENKINVQTIKEDKQEMMGKILELEENSEKLKKELKSKKTTKDSQKSNEQINKLKDEILKRRKDNEEERNRYEDSITLMQKEIDDLKRRLKSLENKLQQNKLEWSEEREKHKETLTAKVKEESLLKTEIQQLNDILKHSKDRDDKRFEESDKRREEIQVKLNELMAELAGKKMATAAQELTFRVIQERLVYTTNEAEKFKQLAQKRIKQLSTFCSSFLRESSEDFEMENDFEKSLDVLKAEEVVKDLESEVEELKIKNTNLSARLDNMVTCSICDEKFECSGERIPTKLKCSHIFCFQCAQGWLQSQGKKASCPQCRTIYRATDIKPINFNGDL